MSIGDSVLDMYDARRSSSYLFFLMIRRPPRSTLDRSSAASDVYKRQEVQAVVMALTAVRLLLSGVNSDAVEHHFDAEFCCLVGIGVGITKR